MLVTFLVLSVYYRINSEYNSDCSICDIILEVNIRKYYVLLASE